MEKPTKYGENLTAVLRVILILMILACLVLFFRKDKNNTENEEIRKEISEASIKENLSSDNKKDFYTEYINQSYKYSIKFPNNWYINNDNSEKELTGFETEDGNKMMAGGQTFWSNYKNINQYSPANKPKDFHLLALTIYKDTDTKNIEEFAKKLEFNEDSQKSPFEINGLEGIEFVSTGLIEGSPRVAIIFQKDSLYYVFNIAFINGDKNVAEEMERIVASFKFN